MHEANVSVWEEKITIPTYRVGDPDKNPMFFEKRVYQGSSGVVYPNPIIEKIADEKSDKEYTALFLENKYLKIMVLPELGGRIHMAFDKIRKRHFVYYNRVIKPALVGLTGPWISGGIEFNWPQHHRPSTFDAIDYKLEENLDGSKTIWVNEVERMFHIKGMAGFTLHPDRAYIEIKAKLFNRSALPQTFLWWANPAVKVNDFYQSVFPPDVNAVFDHGKRDVSDFPIATGTYYKVDYSPGTDISWYKNIPVPTSYMAIHSDYDFVGGYEHDARAGLLHVADHHVSPGKKQWTWGHGDFGQAWDRNLTDEDGPYIELMTGVFTDNQPDFSWLMPYEEKTFTQYFLPYRELAMVKNASKDLLLGVEKTDTSLILRIQATSAQKDLHIQLHYQEELILSEQATICPEEIFTRNVAIPLYFDEQKLRLQVYDEREIELIRYDPAKNKKNELPSPAQPAAEPNSIKSPEILFLTGQHLEQYRHATYSPLSYYEEALRQDPSDIRSNNALGKWYLRKGAFGKAESYLRTAIFTSTRSNPNPYDSEPFYNLGLCLKYLNRMDEAYEAFYKATWSNAWKDAGYFSVAQIDMARGNYILALEHISKSLDRNASNGKACVLQTAVYRKLHLWDKALTIADAALEKDSFNLAAIFEKILLYKQRNEARQAEYFLDQLLKLSRGASQSFIEYALDYAGAGLYSEAYQLLELVSTSDCSNPMVYYTLGWLSDRSGNAETALNLFQLGGSISSYLCFPSRLDEIIILQTAIAANPSDSKAPYYLGNLFYDKGQFDKAVALWEKSELLDSSFPTVLRNLGIAYFNKYSDGEKALVYFERAFALDQSDARILMELDQLYKRLNRSPEFRLKFITEHLSIADQRDDVYLERVSLYNLMDNSEQALNLLQARHFHPWEGGEGKVSGQYVYTMVTIAKQYYNDSSYDKAIEYLLKAKVYPHNLGEGKLLGTQENDIDYWLGCAYEASGKAELARTCFEQAISGLEEPSAAIFYNDQQPDKIFYQGLSWLKLGDWKKARIIFQRLINYAEEHIDDVVSIDYFAVSLPNLLIFEDDIAFRNKTHCYFLKGLGHLGLGDIEQAKAYFTKVLNMDKSHLNGQGHLKMTEHIHFKLI